jgi:DNA-binding CsgD family transcriptional regulator
VTGLHDFWRFSLSVDTSSVGGVESDQPAALREAVLRDAFVGRDRELEELERAWHDAGRMVLVRGTAGIGKSRLVRELATSVRNAGGAAFAGRCSPAATDVPLRPLREALLAAARTGLRPSSELAPYLPALGSLVPEWATASEASWDGGSIVLAEGILRTLAAWGTTGVPTLLTIEDVHWADRETLAAIEYLADNLDGHPVLVILTLRSGEFGLGTEMMDTLVARRSVHAIDLDSLDAAQSSVMIRARPGAELIPAVVADAIIARSDGIPFFIEELLATALAGAATGSRVPPTIGVAIATRLAALPPDAVQFLCHAAVLGRQFDWRVVAAAIGCTPDQAIERLRMAAGAQLLDAEGGSFRFRHALTAEAVQSDLLPEERQAICSLLLKALDALHPELEGELCQLAAVLAAGADDAIRAATLWLEAARRAIRGGWLDSAESLALRAGAWLPAESDRSLVSIWSLAGQPLRALEAGHRILSSSSDLALCTGVRLDLVDAMVAAGRWDDADSYLSSLRSSPDLDRADVCRREIAESEVALGRWDTTAAITLARSALAVARSEDFPEFVCRALWVVGRVERARDTQAASEAFEQARDCATENGLVLARIKSLLELGTIDLYTTLRTDRLEEARREAMTSGALSTAAMVDLQIAAAYSCQGRASLTLAAAERCEQLARPLGLASLPMSLGLQAVAHGLLGDQEAMEATADAARATKGDVVTLEIVLHGNAFGLYHLGRGDLEEALRSLDRCMEVLRATGGSAHPFPGRWALLHTVLNEGGAEARAECRGLELDIEMSRATLLVADAIAAGQAGENAMATFEAGAEALGRLEGGFLRSLALILAAPCAQRDGWGEPATWTREALANFESLGLDAFAVQCRSALRAMGERTPRRVRLEQPKVPTGLAARGVTAREVEVLAHLAAGRTNREIADRLHLSVRTVEKHVERLIMTTDRTRSELAELAADAGVEAEG